MTFDDAEAKFRELQSRVQRGEAISRAEYEDQVSQLAVQDDRGVLWEINPRTGKWMYFDGAEWVGGTPPGRDHSTVMPVPRAPTSTEAPPPSPRPVAAPPPPPAASTTPPVRSSTTPPTRATPVIPPVRTSVGTAPVARAANPATPEAVPVYERKKPGQPGGGTPPAGGGNPPPGGSMTPRFLREGPFAGPNREWVPLAIGAAVLLLCAVLLFFGGRFVLGVLGPSAATTPTRSSPLALATNTALPTLVRLPTAVLPTSTPQPVLAKVIENTVNVRAEPSTKAKVMSSLKKNNQISLVGRNEAGDWYQINLTGGAAPGWVFAATLQIVSGDPKALPVAGTAAPAPTTKAPGPSVVPTPTVIGAKP